MDTAEIDQLFKTRDWTAVEVAQRGGAAIVPAIEPYLRDADEIKRLLAVDCLAAAGGPKVPALLVSALSDKNEQVRNNTVNALHQRLPVGLEKQLIAVWDANHTRDGYLRQQLPMILGRMQARQELNDIKSRLNKDPRQEVNDGIIAGASKLGDAPSRAMFGVLLRDAHGKRTAELIELVKYLDEAWVIPLLVPVLHRRDIALDLSNHAATVLRRDCDLAVDEVLRISKARFSFVINPVAQYHDEQIAEVIRYAENAR